jgi:hypothetical protein
LHDKEKQIIGGLESTENEPADKPEETKLSDYVISIIDNLMISIPSKLGLKNYVQDNSKSNIILISEKEFVKILISLDVKKSAINFLKGYVREKNNDIKMVHLPRLKEYLKRQGVSRMHTEELTKLQTERKLEEKN